MQSKKSQAAMEFMMTYGWAFLAILVVISTLAYFGVLNPDAFMIKRCIMPPEITCRDFEFSYDSISSRNKLILSLQNSRGNVIIINNVSIEDKWVRPNVVLNNADPYEVTLSGINQNIIQKGKKYDKEIKIIYNNTYTGLEHTFIGRISGPSVS